MTQLNHEPLSLKHWLHTTCSLLVFELQPLANDASFRHYFRVKSPDARYVVMIAPPPPKLKTWKPLSSLHVILNNTGLKCRKLSRTTYSKALYY